MSIRIKKDLLNKVVIDAKGRKIGNVTDVELDSESMVAKVLIVKSSIKEETSRLGRILSKMKGKEEIAIPVDYIQAISDYVVLKLKLEDVISKL
ncbi:MAG: hypothetical protein DRJ38_05520 [Thermoprotei archaeon]|nr:MAG: hypothetical protein DRJ38_05520 [Thermoprotei archaeon]